MVKGSSVTHLSSSPSFKSCKWKAMATQMTSQKILSRREIQVRQASLNLSQIRVSHRIFPTRLTEVIWSRIKMSSWTYMRRRGAMHQRRGKMRRTMMWRWSQQRRLSLWRHISPWIHRSSRGLGIWEGRLPKCLTWGWISRIRWVMSLNSRQTRTVCEWLRTFLVERPQVRYYRLTKY